MYIIRNVLYFGPNLIARQYAVLDLFCRWHIHFEAKVIERKRALKTFKIELGF